MFVLFFLNSNVFLFSACFSDDMSSELKFGSFMLVCDFFLAIGAATSNKLFWNLTFIISNFLMEHLAELIYTL